MWVLFVQVFHSTPVIHRMRSTESKISPLHFSLPTIDKQSLFSRVHGGRGLCGCGNGFGKQFGFCLAILSMWKAIAPVWHIHSWVFTFPCNSFRFAQTSRCLLQLPARSRRKLGRGFFSNSQMVITPRTASITWVFLCVCFIFQFKIPLAKSYVSFRPHNS